MTEETMSKRVSVVLPDDVGEILEQMAKDERRSHSQMGAILIEEAIRARQMQQKQLNEKGNGPDAKQPTT